MGSLGRGQVEQLRDNLAAADLILSEEELAALDPVSALPREFPGWMVERQSQDRAQGCEVK